MTYDLIIVGGGLVGASLALALHDSDLSIALIDAKLPSNNDPRLFALNASSCQLLKNIGVYHELINHACPIKEVHVSQQKKFGTLRMHARDVRLSTLGSVIPAHVIESALNAKLTTSNHVKVYCPATLLDVMQDNTCATLTIATKESEQKIKAQFVCAADGTESSVRKALKIPTNVFDYSQSALVTRTQLKRAHEHIAYERFVDNGAIAMLPLNNNECATIWSGSSNMIESLAALDDDTFLCALQKNFGYRLGKLLSVKQRYLFPLHMVIAEKMSDGLVLLLGNALHTLHPIAAQGLNLALYEVAILANTIKEKKKQQQPFLAESFIQVNDMVRKQKEISIGISHRLTKWLSEYSRTMSIALQLGIMGLDIMPSVKRNFMLRMIGRSGRVPQLLLHSDKI